MHDITAGVVLPLQGLDLLTTLQQHRVGVHAGGCTAHRVRLQSDHSTQSRCSNRSDDTANLSTGRDTAWELCAGGVEVAAATGSFTAFGLAAWPLLGPILEVSAF